MRDGFRQSVSQPEIDLQGVESIEVLKGPASALYGRFEPGGVVNFVSKRPYGASSGEAFVVGGSNAYLRGGLDVNAPVTADGAVLARLNVGYENADSHRELVDNEQLYISPVVEWRPDADTIHDLRHTYASDGVLAGEGLPMIGKLLGHTQVQTTARYAHLADHPVREAATRIAGRLASALG